MATEKQLFLVLSLTAVCEFQEILPVSKGQRSCVDNLGVELIKEVNGMKEEIRELRNRIHYLERNQVVKQDCVGWYKFGMPEDGIYRISPDGEHSFEVFCDMQNGGWTIIQQRLDGSVSFDRLWADYKLGFGNLSGDHWIGLNNIHLLTKQSVQISFELLMAVTGNLATAVYYGFQVESEGTNFTMYVNQNGTYNDEMSKYITAAGGFYYQNGMQFSTKDRDNDKCTCNCAHDTVDKRGGFWYNNCYEIGGLNNDFSRIDIFDGIRRPVSRVKIKVK